MHRAGLQFRMCRVTLALMWLCVAGRLMAQAAVAVVTPVAPGTTVTVGVSTQTAVAVATSSLPPARTLVNEPGWDQTQPVDTSKPRPTSYPARLVNVSIRATAASAGNALVAGAVVQGSGDLPVLVRAIGPGLRQFGIINAALAPQLEIYRGSAMSAQTNVVGENVPAVSAYVGAFPTMSGVNGLATGDAALVGRCSAGSITAHCSPLAGTTGVALVEFYDADPSPTATSARFINFSSRTRVEPGDGLVILGFTVAGQGEVRLLLRAAGPSLSQFNLGGVLADPLIELYQGNTALAANDNWRSGSVETTTALQNAARNAGAFDLTSTNDAALIVTLRAGSYTLHVRGATAAQSGLALAEIYELPAAAPDTFNAAESTNTLGVDLFRELAKEHSGQNLILSPYSIETALAMTYVGAEGDTRTEMARVLGLPSLDSALSAQFAGLRAMLMQTADDSKRVADARTASGAPTDPIIWNSANRLFGQRGFEFREAFVSMLRDGFAAPMETMDFATNTEASRRAINAWVEEQTRQKIRNLLPPGAVDVLTRLVLVNALYLKAPWDTPFAKTSTTPRAFRAASGSTIDVPTMQRTGSLGYAVENGFTVITLDYLGRGLQFVIILPDENQNVDAVAARLTSAQFTRWARLGETSPRNLALYLPKFKVEGATLSLNGPLQSLGMKTAFDLPVGSANFDRMAPRKPNEYLAITGVFHQTFVAVDEEGTEAAAATAISVGTTSVPPPPMEVRVDRPFLFAIQHRASAVCLFLGRISDPR